MELDILSKLIPNAVSAVAVIIVVVIFLKSQTKFMDTVEKIRSACHDQNAASQKVFQDQIETVVDRHEKLANGYHDAMVQFGTAIGKNGEILKSMEKALVHVHRRATDPKSKD